MDRTCGSWSTGFQKMLSVTPRFVPVIGRLIQFFSAAYSYSSPRPTPRMTEQVERLEDEQISAGMLYMQVRTTDWYASERVLESDRVYLEIGKNGQNEYLLSGFFRLLLEDERFTKAFY